MDIPHGTPHRGGLLDRRFFAHHMLARAEGRGTAALYSMFSFLFALLSARTHAVFGAYPFAIGYLTALDRRAPAAYLGALCGALSLGERGYVYAVCYGALFFLRLFLSYPRAESRLLGPCREFFEEEAPLRLFAACFGGLFLSVYEWLAGGLSMLSLAFALCSLLLSVLLCFSYLGFFLSGKTLFACLLEEARPGRLCLRGFALPLSLGAFGFSLVFACGSFSLFGLSLSLLLSAFFCLLYPRRFGLLPGLAAAILAACPAVFSPATAAYLPAFAAMAAVCALLYPLGYLYALVGSTVAGGLVAYLLTGGSAILSFFPELFVCLALTWPLFHRLPGLLQAGAAGGEGEVPAHFAPAEPTLEKFSSAYASMAAVFARLGSSRVHMEGERVRDDRYHLLSRQWQHTADLLQDAAGNLAQERQVDRALAAAVARAMADLGAPAKFVSVTGCRRRQILARGVRWEADHPAEETLRARLGALCACRLSPPLLSLHGGLCELRYTAAPCLSLSVYTAGVSRGREVSGDVFSHFMGEGERYYALLSDGMGSGREAAVTAGICASFYAGMLAAGAGKEKILSALNTLLCEREEECGATLDLLEIDLLTGRAEFLKCGAAASYMRRGDSLFHIPAGQLPLGILPTPQAEGKAVQLEVGDRVILLSDGVSQGPEDSFWLCELLSGTLEKEDELLAERILLGARAHGEEQDDMTVAILTVTLPQGQKDP